MLKISLYHGQEEAGKGERERTERREKEIFQNKKLAHTISCWLASSKFVGHSGSLGTQGGVDVSVLK